jgi:hypothetical protein
MDAESDRGTRVREAILLWLLENKRRNGNPMPWLRVADIEAAAGWQDEPIQDWELTDATVYLGERGFISGPEGMGSGIRRPSLTAAGEDFIASGQSLRPTAPRAGSSFSFGDIHAANLVIGDGNSVHQSQTTNEMEFGPALEVADLLDKIAAGPDVPAATSAAVRDTADEIRNEVAKPSPVLEVVKALVFKAATTIAGDLGPVLGHDLTQLALQAWHTL